MYYFFIEQNVNFRSNHTEVYVAIELEVRLQKRSSSKEGQRQTNICSIESEAAAHVWR
jgi:hypothetical protein